MSKSFRMLVVAIAILGGIATTAFLHTQPAQAATMDMCQQGNTIASLRMCVVHCDTMGYITDHTLTGMLLYFVDDAQSAVDNGSTGAALADLQVFSMLLQAESGQQILAVHVNDMLQKTQAIMQALANAALTPSNAQGA